MNVYLAICDWLRPRRHVEVTTDSRTGQFERYHYEPKPTPVEHRIRVTCEGCGAKRVTCEGCGAKSVLARKVLAPGEKIQMTCPSCET